MGRTSRSKAAARAPQEEQPRQVTKQEEMFPQAVRYAATSYHSGPLPDPDTLFQYNEIAPGAADRIIAMAEREQRHRHETDRALVRMHSRNTAGGLVSATLIGLAAIGGGAYGMVNGGDIAGAGVALGGLASLVWVYVTGKKSEERQERG
jgi:uncharacterized membrane protein